MLSTIRRKLNTINRVYLFSQRHSAEIPGYIDTVTQLGNGLKRVETLSTQAEAGQSDEAAMIARKIELRRQVEEDHLVHIVRIARAVTPADPELKKRFRRPKGGLGHLPFVATVRAVSAEAASRRELFVGEGLPATFVEDLDRALAQYVEAANAQSAGAAAHVGASADLEVITKELMLLVRRLNGINRYRFRDDAELLAAWNSAKDVAWPAPVPPEAPKQPSV